MKTFLLDPTVGDRATAVVGAVNKLLREGKQVVVTVVDETKRYEDLRDGRIGRRELGSLRDLTTALVEARIFRSMGKGRSGGNVNRRWGELEGETRRSTASVPARPRGHRRRTVRTAEIV